MKSWPIPMRLTGNCDPRFQSLLAGLTVVAALSTSTFSFAQLPAGPAVVSGSVSFANAGNALTVTNSPSAIINWQSFNIGVGNTTRFEQQSSSSNVLNRVVTSNPSTIFGTLSSNGNVFLVNPNGILFGAGSRVDTGGFAASTLGLSDANFLSGQYVFSATSNVAALTLSGTVTTAGFTVLLAPTVNISGSIQAGTIAIGAGESANLQLGGVQVSGLTVDSTNSQNVINLLNVHSISASGLTVLASSGPISNGNVVTGPIISTGPVQVSPGTAIQTGGTADLTIVGNRSSDTLLSNAIRANGAWPAYMGSGQLSPGSSGRITTTQTAPQGGVAVTANAAPAAPPAGMSNASPGVNAIGQASQPAPTIVLNLAKRESGF